MVLREKLSQELKRALKAKQEFQINALREMMSALRYAEVEKKRELTPAEELEVLTKLKKRHLESIDAFEKGHRSELVAKEREELAVIERFLPQPLTPEEIRQMVKQAITELGAKGLKEMGKVMALLKDQYLGRADGKLVSEEVRTQLLEREGP